MLKKNVIASLLLVSSMSVYANNNQDEKMYVSAGIANIEVDLGISSTSAFTVDDSDTVPVVMVGYKLDDNFALEAGMIGSSEVSITTTSNITAGTYLGRAIVINSGTKITAAANESWLFGGAYRNKLTDDFEISARGGLMFWDVDYKVDAAITYGGTSISTNGTLLSEDGSDLYLGFGADYSLTDNLAIEASYLSTEVNGDDVSALTFGIKHKF